MGSLSPPYYGYKSLSPWNGVVSKNSLMCVDVYIDVFRNFWHKIIIISFGVQHLLPQKKHCCPPRGLSRFWHARGIQLHLPKSHRSLASHQAQADKTSRCWHSSSTCFEGNVALPFSWGTFLFETPKDLAEKFSKISFVMICYLWVRSKSWQIAVFRHKQKKRSGNLPPSNAVK